MGKLQTRSLRTLAICSAVVASASIAQQLGSAPPKTNDNETREYVEAFDKAFRTAFRVKSVNQCVAAAPKAAAAGLDITPTCACFTDTLLATKSVKQLQEMKLDDSSEELKALTASCLKSDPPWAVGQQSADKERTAK